VWKSAGRGPSAKRKEAEGLYILSRIYHDESYYKYKIPPNCVVIRLFGATVSSTHTYNQIIKKAVQIKMTEEGIEPSLLRTARKILNTAP
jgi:hypothetical protein